MNETTPRTMTVKCPGCGKLLQLELGVNRRRVQVGATKHAEYPNLYWKTVERDPDHSIRNISYVGREVPEVLVDTCDANWVR